MTVCYMACYELGVRGGYKELWDKMQELGG